MEAVLQSRLFSKMFWHPAVLSYIPGRLCQKKMVETAVRVQNHWIYNSEPVVRIHYTFTPADKEHLKLEVLFHSSLILILLDDISIILH